MPKPIKHFPEQPEERCSYSLAAENPNSTTGAGLRSKHALCTRCRGKRAEAVKYDCYSQYFGVINGEGHVMRRKDDCVEGGEGFIFSEDYSAYKKEAREIEEEQIRVQRLERELWELESLPPSCKGSGAVMRIVELREILGKD